MRSTNPKTAPIQGRQTGSEQRKFSDKDTTIDLVGHHNEINEGISNTRAREFMASNKKINAYGIFCLKYSY